VSNANALNFLFQLHSCVSKGLCYYENPGMIVKEGSISYFPYCIRSGKHTSHQLSALLPVMFLQITLSLYSCCFLLFRKAVKTHSLLSEYSESQTQIFLPVRWWCFIWRGLQLPRKLKKKKERKCKRKAKTKQSYS